MQPDSIEAVFSHLVYAHDSCFAPAVVFQREIYLRLASLFVALAHLSVYEVNDALHGLYLLRYAGTIVVPFCYLSHVWQAKNLYTAVVFANTRTRVQCH